MEKLWLDCRLRLAIFAPMNRYFAEMMGTFGLVLVGTGAVVVNDVHDGLLANAGIAIAFGVIVMLMIFVFGKSSGAHINPAVTIAFWLSGRFPGREVLPYIGAQVAGGIIASIVVMMIYPTHETLGSTIPAGSNTESFLWEIGLTFVLMSVIIFVTSGRANSVYVCGIAIGAAVLFGAFFGGPVSGASMNPARSIAPALFSGHMGILWLYITAPVFGAVLAILGCRVVKSKECCPGPGACKA